MIEGANRERLESIADDAGPRWSQFDVVIFTDDQNDGDEKHQNVLNPVDFNLKWQVAGVKHRKQNSKQSSIEKTKMNSEDEVYCLFKS